MYECSPEEYEEAHRPKPKRRGGGGSRRRSGVNREVVEEANLNKDIVAKLVLLLCDKRFSEYHYWSRLCWILKGLGEEYQDLFLFASSKSSKFDSWSCDKLWAKSEFRGLGIATLKYWVKEDDPDGYRSIMCTERNNEYVRSLAESCEEIVF